MGRYWFVLSIILVFTFSTSGCFGTTDSYYYSVEDTDDPNTIETSDILFSLTLKDDGGVDMDISDLVVIIKYSGTHTCSTSGTEGNCTVVQPAESDDSIWEIGETLNIIENGVNICSQHCILAFSVDGPEDAKVVGPTILNIT
tara:strand:+ start:42 stop:470 length:429 start_codon:yes stop_codon:yes gene_type:complete